VVAGGALTVAAAVAWPLLFRELDEVDGFESLRPEAVPSLADP
jgi:hypothetical protein